VKNKKNIHVLNAPSPAATACLAIGKHIVAEATTHFKL
jgi:L-2-hydroxyglutarate oxidase LhgO